MEHKEFTKRLIKVGLTPKKLPRSTLRNWARDGLIPGPKAYSKEGERGRFRNWPEEAVEEAAAVWALRNLKLDRFLSRPTSNMVKLVKLEAKAIHERFKTDVDFPEKIHDRGFNLEGKEGFYLKSYDLHAFIVTWIATIEKVRHNKSVIEPANVIFNWERRHVGSGKFEFQYKDVTFEPSDCNIISGRYHRLL